MKLPLILLTLLMAIPLVSATTLIDMHEVLEPNSEQTIILRFYNYEPSDIYLAVMEAGDDNTLWISENIEGLKKVSKTLYTYSFTVPNNIQQGEYIVSVLSIDGEDKKEEATIRIDVEGKTNKNFWRNLLHFFDEILAVFSQGVSSIF